MNCFTLYKVGWYGLIIRLKGNGLHHYITKQVCFGVRFTLSLPQRNKMKIG